MMKKQKWFAALLACCLVLGAALPALATTVDEITALAEQSDDPLQTLREELERIQNERDQIQANIQTEENRKAGLQNELAQIDQELILIAGEITAAEAAVAALTVDIEECDASIADTEQRIAERQALLESRLVNLYVHGDIDLLDVIFETDSFADFLTIADLTARIMEQDRALIEEIATEQELLRQLRAALELKMNDLVEAQRTLLDKQTSLNLAELEKEAAINEANWTIAEYNAYEDSLAAAAEAAGNTIRELLASSTYAASYNGVMYWPLPSSGVITSHYGWRRHPVYGDDRFHSGVDIGIDGGTPIYAASDGEIILKEYYGGYGYTIMINHGDGLVTLYAHQSSFGAFDVGDFVVGGVDVIGYVGTTGTSTGNHLHFEIRQDGSTVDPFDYVTQP